MIHDIIPRMNEAPPRYNYTAALCIVIESIFALLKLAKALDARPKPKLTATVLVLVHLRL